jgi:hypothetical protein
MDIHTNGQTDGWMRGKMDSHINGQTDRQEGRKTDSVEGQTDLHNKGTDIQGNRWIDRQMNVRTDGLT